MQLQLPFLVIFYSAYPLTVFSQTAVVSRTLLSCMLPNPGLLPIGPFTSSSYPYQSPLFKIIIMLLPCNSYILSIISYSQFPALSVSAHFSYHFRGVVFKGSDLFLHMPRVQHCACTLNISCLPSYLIELLCDIKGLLMMLTQTIHVKNCPL